MKKLNKLSIDSEKIIKDEQLVNLKGGYPVDCGSGPMYFCGCYSYPIFWVVCAGSSGAEDSIWDHCNDGIGWCGENN